MSEQELLEAVTKLADKYQLYWHHCNDSRRCTGKRGCPDLVIAGPNGLLFAELKTNYGSMSIHQTDWKYKIQASGHKWVLWIPYDLEDGTIETVLASLA